MDHLSDSMLEWRQTIAVTAEMLKMQVNTLKEQVDSLRYTLDSANFNKNLALIEQSMKHAFEEINTLKAANTTVRRWLAGVAAFLICAGIVGFFTGTNAYQAKVVVLEQQIHQMQQGKPSAFP